MRGGTVVALALLVGCGRTPPPGATVAMPDSSAASTAGDYVALERGPCFGACPVYRVTLRRTGVVTFEGRRFVADSGMSRDSIPPASVDSLFRRLEAAGWSAFVGQYAMGEPGCGRFATDLPAVVSEVSLGGSVQQVRHDHGCQGAPEVLDRLERSIDSVAGVAQWVGR